MENEKSFMESEQLLTADVSEELIASTAEDEPIQIFQEDCPSSVEEATEPCREQAPADYRQMIRNKCAEMQSRIKATADRISRDLEETNGNPHFRQTVTYKLEVLRSAEDEEPVDVFEVEQVHSFSLCSLALVGTASLLVKNAGEKLLKKLKEVQ